MKKVYLAQCDPGFCTNGVEAFFNVHNLDFKDFKKNGIDPQTLIDTQDYMAAKLAARAVDENQRKLRYWEILELQKK